MKRVMLVVAVMACSRHDASADCDLSTKAGISAAYLQATGNKLLDDGCARRSETFPDLLWVGTFADDRGCTKGELIANCKLSPPGYEAAAMVKAGWVKADMAKRTKLALAWLKEIDDQQIVDTAPGKLGDKFTPPAVTKSGKDVVVEAWVWEDGGKLGPMYHRIKVTFADDGTHGKIIATTETITTR